MGGLRDGTLGKADSDVAERFRLWQEAQTARTEDEETVRSALSGLRKDQDRLATLRGDVERGAEKKARKRREVAARAKNPEMRESHAQERGDKTIRKHLALGLDADSSVNLGWARYRAHNGRMNLVAWKQQFTSPAKD